MTQCAQSGGGLNVYVTLDTSTIIPVVCCGVVQPFFYPGVSGANVSFEPLVDAATTELPLNWWWTPAVNTNNSASYFLQNSLWMSYGDEYVTTDLVQDSYSTVSLPTSGVVPFNDDIFYVEMHCEDTFIASVELSFSLMEQTDSNLYLLLPSVTFALRWQCYLPGCSDYCYINNSTCNYLLGECACSEGWDGLDCCLKFYYSPTYTMCPTDVITMTFYIP